MPKKRERLDVGRKYPIQFATKGSLASRILAFIRQLPVHHGEYRLLQKVKPLKWQERVIRGTFPNDRHIKQSVISVPRKVGKSQVAVWCILAFILLPELRKTNAQIYALSKSTNQANLLFNSVVAILDLLTDDIFDTLDIKAKVITVPKRGITFRVIACDTSGARLQGFSPQFCVIDEAGSIESVMPYQSISTANPGLVMMISTQCHLPLAEEQWFSQILHDKEQPSYHYRYFKGATQKESNDRHGDEAVWKRVTPGLGKVKSLEYMKQQYANAIRHNNLNSWRTFHLNALCPHTSNEIDFVTSKEIEACWLPKEVIEPSSKVLIGLDLSQVHDLSSVVVYDIKTGVTESFFWIPLKAVNAISGSLRNNYQQWQEQGHCQIVKDNCVDFSTVAKKIKDYEKQFKVLAICRDHWLANQYQFAADKEGVKAPHFSVQQMGQPMGVACKALQTAIKSGMFAITNPILRWNFNCVRWSEDTHLNVRPHKGLSQIKTNRVDGVFATTNIFWYCAQHDLTPNMKGFTVNFLGEKK